MSFQKELPFFWKEEVEPREVNLLLVHLDLREVRVVGQVRGEVLGDAVLGIKSDSAGAVISGRWVGGAVCGDASDTVWFELENRTHVGRLDSYQCGIV